MNIRIRNWEKFQHRDATRSDLTPPWIKDYTRQLSDEDYLDLTFHQRGILHGLRLEYARAGRDLPDSTATLTRRLGQRVMRRDLTALNHAGFIEYVPAQGQQPAGLEPNLTEPNQTQRPGDNESREETSTALIAPPTAQNLLGRFIDQARSAGIEPPDRLKGQLASAIKSLLDEGQSTQAVWAGLGRMIERRIVQPSLLPNFVFEAAIPRDVGQQTRFGRGMTTEQIRRKAG